MRFLTRAIVVVAMIGLTVVSIWTSYASLHDSVLPAPDIPIRLPNGVLWECSLFALILSVALGLLLLALKLAMIEGAKRVTLAGFLGLAIVASLSIAFNVDVLYRWANPDFYLNYSHDRLREAYDPFLAEVSAALESRREARLPEAMRPGAALDAPTEGLQPGASEANAAASEGAFAPLREFEELLRGPLSPSAEELDALQARLRVAADDLSTQLNLPRPEAPEIRKPLFAVFDTLIDGRGIGAMEVLILLLAVVLDLGDVVGFSLIPTRPRTRRAADPDFLEPDFPPLTPAPVVRRPIEHREEPLPEEDPFPEDPFEERLPAVAPEPSGPPRHGPRPVRFHRRR